MTNVVDPDVQFAANFAVRCPELELRAECEADRPFLIMLFCDVSPLAASLPQAIVEMQAQMQDQGYAHEFPTASRWIVLREEQPIGRIIIDWDIDGLSHCVDVAIAPAEQGGRIGTALLSAWIDTSDRLGSDCCLQVLADSPATAIYQRLGFAAVDDTAQPSITMIRPSAG